LLALLDERARFVGQSQSDAAARTALDDLLRRHAGPVSAQAVRAYFASVEAACAEHRLRGVHEEHP
jgi:hypothetical protein